MDVIVVVTVVVVVVDVVVEEVVDILKFFDARKFVWIVLLVVDIRYEGVENGDVFTSLQRIFWHPVRQFVDSKTDSS
jgi:hypothetical protein